MTKQKKKQRLVTEQINEIRNNVKVLREYVRAGLYIDRKQEKALNGIFNDALELAS
jgi:hypothetical protein